MKISISKTELYALPHTAWNEYCYYMMDMGITEYDAQFTPIQKTASLCFFYHADMCEGGHEGYFEYGENANKDELIQALRTIGAQEFADNFIEAVEAGAKDDDYVKTDTWFGENEETLRRKIEKYLRENASEIYEIVDEDYTMRYSKYFYRIGVIGVAFFLALMTIFIIVGTKGAFIAAGGFAAFGLLSAFLALYVKTWKITVKKDAFTVYTLFRKPREFSLYDISTVRHKLDGLVAYVDGRKAFTVDSIVSDFEIFKAQLHEAGRMESTQKKDDFVVSAYKGNLVFGLLGFVAIVALFIWIILWPDEPVDVIKSIISLVVTLGALCPVIHSVLWRITVSGDTMTVKKALGSKKRYYIQDITKADFGKEKLVLYIDNKKIAKVAYNCDGYPTLIERLENENIPFYEKGQPVK